MGNNRIGCGSIGCLTVIVLFFGTMFIGKSISDMNTSDISVPATTTATTAPETFAERAFPIAEETPPVTVTEITAIEESGDPLPNTVAEYDISDPDDDVSEETSAENTASEDIASENISRAEKSTEVSSLIKGVTPEFKAQMDSYEAFFDEYIDFMTKFSSEDADTSAMFFEYLDMLTKYSEFMAAMESIDQEELSEADLAYYLEVTMRIEAKLLGTMIQMGSDTTTAQGS